MDKQSLMPHNKLLIILGPTATGKTDLALFLAKLYGGELISCDSRQVYKGLDIGTGKFPGKEVRYEKYDKVWLVDDVPIWLYDVVSPIFQYDVWQYVSDARDVIHRIRGEGKLPILVGGTGMYLKALLEGFSDMDIPVDLNLRAELDQLSKTEIQKKLADLDLAQFESLNNSELNNKRRLIRRIEKILLRSEAKKSSFNKGIKDSFDVLKIGLRTERSKLYQRIDQRVVNRINDGMIAEAERLLGEGVTFNRMRELGLEYRLLAEYLEGKIGSKEEFIIRLQYRIHQYAKRQLNWFNSDKEITWFDISGKNFYQEVEEFVLGWYNRTTK